jgi:glycosyltransferase involved in cell wall biosynthesis
MPDVVLPVLDEEEALPRVLAAMPAGFRPIVVDNGSRDGSAAVARSLGAEVIGESRKGFGAACAAGLAAARDPVVCFMDCDGSLDPGELPRVAAAVELGELDLVIGARRADPRAWPLHARACNRVLTLELRRRSGIALADLGPMRAARRERLERLGIVDRRFGWPLEMVLRAASAGWRIGQVDVRYSARIGRSKVTGTAKGTVRAIADMARVMREPGIERADG